MILPLKGVNVSDQIVIDLNDPKASVKKDFVYKKELDKVLQLIEERVKDIQKIEKEFDIAKEQYEKTRMHDAILIDGKRGSGKTTFLINVIHRIKGENDKKNKNDTKNQEGLANVKILDSIDPNQLDNKSNILLIIIANVYTALLETMQKNTSDTKHYQFKELSTMIHELVSAISASQERNYEDDYHKLYNLHKSLIIDETLHEFFSKVCKFFDVIVLVLPIDDIDMDFMHGYKVIDAIRKYLSTPKIIPIVSVNTAQMYALIKKKHYPYFGYSAKTAKNEIKLEHELDFLKSLPEEYIQKILMPTRKIVLPDIYELYKMHIRMNNISIEYNMDISDTQSLQFKINLGSLLKAYINIVYGYAIKDLKDIDNPYILNYLKGKTFRSFSEDIIAFLNGFRAFSHPQSESKYIAYETQNIKDRMTPMHIDHFDTKYDATIWFWDRYLNVLKKRIEHFIHEHGIPNSEYYAPRFHIDVLRDILYIDSFAEKKFIANEQIYARLYMQDFFIEKNTIEISCTKDDQKETLVVGDFTAIKKEITILGCMKLLTRTMLPAHIFENLINENIVNVFKYNIGEFKYLGRDNAVTLRETMFNLSTSILRYYDEETFATHDNSTSAESSKKIVGMFLSTEHRQLFGEYALLIEKYIDFRQDKTIYFLSPLKFYAMMPQYFKAIQNQETYRLETILKTLSKEYDSNPKDIYGFAYPLLESEDIVFEVSNSDLGVIAIDEFAKNLAKNTLQVAIRAYTPKFIDDALRTCSEAHYRLFLNKHISTYKSIYFNQLVLFIAKQIDNDFFYSALKEIQFAYITHGVREKDFGRYKMYENFFARNIKTIFKAMKKDTNNDVATKEKYQRIEPFLYKLYLTMLKNIQYQSSYYIQKDKYFDIKYYIKRYIDELKTKSKPTIIDGKLDISMLKEEEQKQFGELKDLYDNLDSLYAEGAALKEVQQYDQEKKQKIHGSLIGHYEELYKSNKQDYKKTMYDFAKNITKYITNDVAS